ncbi:hypothetical protein [Archangium lansingense]|uniref:Uncharacterized protein n=1 Tax=Archangium lansingense TaxID=2995310 RepID=A0ABT4AMV3_9BACT|nr:hypothetical protein [Archangium lansinium]MCY1083028.1 hypothetical protein [Archangium lansinium]
MFLCPITDTPEARYRREPWAPHERSPAWLPGRLVGTAVAAEGSLLVTDDARGVIYRSSYTGG